MVHPQPDSHSSQNRRTRKLQKRRLRPTLNMEVVQDPYHPQTVLSTWCRQESGECLLGVCVTPSDGNSLLHALRETALQTTGARDSTEPWKLTYAATMLPRRLRCSPDMHRCGPAWAYLIRPPAGRRSGRHGGAETVRLTDTALPRKRAHQTHAHAALPARDGWRQHRHHSHRCTPTRLPDSQWHAIRTPSCAFVLHHSLALRLAMRLILRSKSIAAKLATCTGSRTGAQCRGGTARAAAQPLLQRLLRR